MAEKKLNPSAGIPAPSQCETEVQRLTVENMQLKERLSQFEQAIKKMHGELQDRRIFEYFKRLDYLFEITKVATMPPAMIDKAVNEIETMMFSIPEQEVKE